MTLDTLDLNKTLAELGAPLYPHESWLREKPERLVPGTDVFVDLTAEIGRAAGYVGAYDGPCHLNYPHGPGVCWRPKPSPTGNELFNRKPMEAIGVDGSIVYIKQGTIGAGGDGHSGARSLAEAQRYHDQIQWQSLVGRIEEDDYGPYFIGAALPHLTVADAMAINRSALSGEWQWRPVDSAMKPLEDYDLIAPWVVSHPALPMIPMSERRYGPTGVPVMASASIVAGHPTMTLVSAGADNCACGGDCCTPGFAASTATIESEIDMDRDELKALIDERITEALKPAEEEVLEGTAATDTPEALLVSADTGEAKQRLDDLSRLVYSRLDEELKANEPTFPEAVDA